jgi:nucleotide-binding universal stress UspA family protein
MKILLPVDGSAPALAAVRHALALAAQGLRATYVLANVQEPPSLYEVVVAHDPDVLAQVRGAAGDDLLQPAATLLDAAGAEYESEVAGGDPTTLLADLAENYGCDLIVIGARGISQPEGRGLGSVAHALLLHSSVPVTVVRLTPAESVPAEPEGDESAGVGAADDTEPRGPG